MFKKVKENKSIGNTTMSKAKRIIHKVINSSDSFLFLSDSSNITCGYDDINLISQYLKIQFRAGKVTSDDLKKMISGIFR